jgi:hypothetical protein
MPMWNCKENMKTTHKLREEFSFINCWRLVFFVAQNQRFIRFKSGNK